MVIASSIYTGIYDEPNEPNIQRTDSNPSQKAQEQTKNSLRKYLLEIQA